MQRNLTVGSKRRRARSWSIPPCVQPFLDAAAVGRRDLAGANRRRLAADRYLQQAIGHCDRVGVGLLMDQPTRLACVDGGRGRHAGDHGPAVAACSERVMMKMLGVRSRDACLHPFRVSPRDATLGSRRRSTRELKSTHAK